MIDMNDLKALLSRWVKEKEYLYSLVDVGEEPTFDVGSMVKMFVDSVVK
jgi:hypothetical protein